MADITVIGSFVMDSVASVQDFPRAGQTILGKSVRTYPGGKGINQCVAAARLGGKTAMVGMLGKDGNGAVFSQLLKEEGIGADKVFFTDCEPTGVAQIQINEVGENKITVIPSANFLFSLAHLKETEKLISSSKLVVMQFELTAEVTEGIIFTAKRLGIPILLNPAPARTIAKEALSYVDYITPNETELEILSGHSAATDADAACAAQILLHRGVKNVVATRGSRGAMIANGEGVRFVQGYRVEAVDTVAAGDAFNGALAKKIVEGASLEAAVRYANAVGALTVTKKGAIPSLPYETEVNAFLAEQDVLSL